MFLRTLLSVAALSISVSAADRPNIVVILVDDMGWSDIACFGGEIPTPNLDALAKDGVRFTRFYNTGRCCPTRASLLTGLYPHQTGIGHMTTDQGLPGYQGRLNDRCVTMAEVLQPEGYFTAMSGKWHVGQNLGVTPAGRGFTRSLNAPAGGFYQPESQRAKLTLDGKAIANDDPILPKNWYTTDLWTDFGIRFIDEAREQKKPFFLYLAHNAPHFPLQAPAASIEKFRHGVYMKGWDKLREERYARQKEMGLIDPAWPLAPRPESIPAWDSLADKEKERFDHLMATYAACVWHMDQSIGKLVDALKSRGELENTLILFMSDNGGNAESGPNGKTQGEPTEARSQWFCGESWASLQNTPFRLYKHYNHEGGIATPLIAHWPTGISAKGELRKQPGHLVDVMATVVDVSGANYPKEFKGHAIQPMEGRSLAAAFANKPIEREALFWEHEGNAAVSVGDWKLARKGRQGSWELYDLKQDRTEQKDLSSSQPERVKELKAKWQEWAKRAQVLPAPGGKNAKGGKAGKNASEKDPE